LPSCHWCLDLLLKAEDGWLLIFIVTHAARACSLVSIFLKINSSDEIISVRILVHVRLVQEGQLSSHFKTRIGVRFVFIHFRAEAF